MQTIYYMTDDKDSSLIGLNYLDPNTGEMLTGWREIKGQWYYLNPETLGDSGWMQDSSTKQWNYNVKAVMPKGALYVNTQTPDGYFVDENGVRR